MLLQQQTNTVKCLKEGNFEYNLFKCALMQEEHGLLVLYEEDVFVWTEQCCVYVASDLTFDLPW